MSITYEEALATLQSMFGEPWNRDNLDTVLRYQKGHMENTVDMILRHGNQDPDILIDQIENGTVESNNTSSATTNNSNNAMTAIDEQLARQLSQQTNISSTPTALSSATSSSSSSGGASSATGKGKVTTLPDDFLRPPGYVPGRMMNSISDDEALARMLQDELFTEELRRNPDFAHLAHGRRASSDARLRSSSGRSNTSNQQNSNTINPAAAAVNRLGEFARSLTSGGQQQQQQRDSNSNNNNNTVPASPNILEKISELGDNAKRRLQLLAAQFNANNNNNNNRTEMDDGVGTRRAPEFRSLLDNDDDNMELAARKDL